MSARPSQMSGSPARKRQDAPSHLSVVRRRSRGLIQRSASRRAAPVVVAALVVVVVMVVGVLLEQVLMAQSAFKLGRMRERLTKAEQVHEELMWKASQLESPARIQRYARDRLGMIDPDPLAAEYIVADISDPSGGHLARLEDPASLPATGQAAAGAPGAEGP